MFAANEFLRAVESLSSFFLVFFQAESFFHWVWECVLPVFFLIVSSGTQQWVLFWSFFIFE